MANEFVFVMEDLRKVVGEGRVILDGINLSFFPGAKIGVLGHNGAGKSSLLRIMAGIDTDIMGEARPLKGLKVGFLPQEPQLDESKDVLGNVEEGVQEIRDLLNDFNAISDKFAEPMEDDEMNALLEKQAILQDKIDAVDAWEIDRTLEVAMDALRCPPGDAEVKSLSGGEKRRVALCRLLLSKPDMLLLDEPTNHLDAESVAWLERFLSEYAGTVVAVTHDRYFLDNVAGWILELDRGRGIPWKGNYSSWLDQKQKRLEVEEKQKSAHARTLARELEWIQMSPRARQAKGKARINAYEQLLSEGQDRAPEKVEIAIPVPQRLGDVVVEAKGLRKGFDGKLLIDDLDFSLPPGGIVGVIGANGAGKSTLFKMIVGEEKPDAGEIRLGETVQLAYVDQSRDALDPEKNVWQVISGGEEMIAVGKREIPSRAYVSSFNFKGPDQQKLVGSLSGGERNRVHLAKLLRAGGNVLLLDEPTNDLDVDTLRALEDALEKFAGCAVVISHDRWFLDRIATHILAFEGDSHVEWFEGNYQDYDKDYHRPPPPAPTPAGPDTAPPRRPPPAAPGPGPGSGPPPPRPRACGCPPPPRCPGPRNSSETLDARGDERHRDGLCARGGPTQPRARFGLAAAPRRAPPPPPPEAAGLRGTGPRRPGDCGGRCGAPFVAPRGPASARRPRLSQPLELPNAPPGGVARRPYASWVRWGPVLPSPRASRPRAAARADAPLLAPIPLLGGPDPPSPGAPGGGVLAGPPARGGPTVFSVAVVPLEEARLQIEEPHELREFGIGAFEGTLPEGHQPCAVVVLEIGLRAVGQCNAEKEKEDETRAGDSSEHAKTLSHRVALGPRPTC